MSIQLDQEYLKSIMSYDPETGVMTWIKSKRKDCIGKPAGTVMSSGHLTTLILKKHYLIHRLVWLYIYGYFPKGIDHKNGIRTDNRLCNLRVAGHDENAMNQSLRSDNTSGFKGVSFRRATGRWSAYITHKGMKIQLGYFIDINDAARVVAEARDRLHGEFANHGQFKH